MPLETSIDRFGRSGASVVAEFMRDRSMEIPMPVGEEVIGLAVVALVSHGRWIAECECKSAQLLDPDDQKFFCIRCFNVNNDGGWRPVQWPANRNAIEQVLLARPDFAIRNWLPTETVEMLQAENEAHGLPVS